MCLIKEAEDNLIIEMQAEMGNQWSKIALELEGRSDNAVKNRWYSFARINKKRDRVEKYEDSRVNVQEKMVSTTVEQVDHSETQGHDVSQLTKNVNEHITNYSHDYLYESEEASTESTKVEINEENSAELEIGRECEQDFKQLEDENNAKFLVLAPNARSDDEDFDCTINVHSPKRFRKSKSTADDDCNSFVSSSVDFTPIKREYYYSFEQYMPVVPLINSPHATKQQGEKTQPVTQVTPSNNRLIKRDEIPLVSVSDSKRRMNLSEWFKNAEQGPSLGCDTTRTLEMLSPASIRFSA